MSPLTGALLYRYFCSTAPPPPPPAPPFSSYTFSPVRYGAAEDGPLPAGRSQDLAALRLPSRQVGDTKFTSQRVKGGGGDWGEIRDKGGGKGGRVEGALRNRGRERVPRRVVEGES